MRPFIGLLRYNVFLLLTKSFTMKVVFVITHLNLFQEVDRKMHLRQERVIYHVNLER